MPVLSSRLRVLRLPFIVGDILAGIVIGQSGFNLVEKTPPLDFLAEFGFTFLMFLSELEVSFGALSHSLRDGNGNYGCLQSFAARPVGFGTNEILKLTPGCPRVLKVTERFSLDLRGAL